MIYVQHLLGSGHLRRAAALARACAAGGMDTLLVSGGRSIRDLDYGRAAFTQLPPTAARDERFSSLINERGAEVDDAWRAARRDALLAAFEKFRPDALITETYPFGRRQMAFELAPLLDAAWSARPRPLIIASIRDILQAKSGKVSDQMAAIARRFDHVLVHGDPDFIALDASFPLDAGLAAKLAYTGYIAEPAEARGKPGDPGWDEVIVSSGGGAVGAALLSAALAARPLSKAARAVTWRLLAGGELPAGDFARLQVAAPHGVIVERARTDFRRLLANAKLSVSQAGYNTVMEILAARVPAVLVPFAGNGQTEQPLRADLLRARGRAELIAENALVPSALAAAIDRALASPVPEIALKRDGAAESARLINTWLAGRAPAA